MNKLLVIEDDVGIQKQLKWALSDFDVIFAKDRDTAISQLRRHSPCVVTLDLGLPPDAENASEGLAALEQMLALDPGCKVIVITGNEDKQNALKAIKLGAHDFYQKPINDEELTVIINRAFFVASIEEENAKQEIIDQEDSAIIGNSPEVMKVKSMINKVAPTELTTCCWGKVVQVRIWWLGKSTKEANGTTSLSSPSTALLSQRTCWKVSCLAMKKGPLPAPIKQRRVRLNVRMAVPVSR